MSRCAATRRSQGEVSVTGGPDAVLFETVSVEQGAELIGSVPKGIARSGLKLGKAGDQWRGAVIVDV